MLDGDPATPPKAAQPLPQFYAYICCGQTAGCIKIPLGGEVGLGPSDIMLDGDPDTLPKRGHSPQFLAHVYCSQTVAWIKMQLGTEIVLGAGHIVLDGDTQLLCAPKRGTAPNFRLMSVVAKRLDGSRCQLVLR